MWVRDVTDLAYLIASSASPELLTFDGQGEAALLDLYYSLLCESLRAGGVPEERWISRSELTVQFETALLDLCRLVVAYTWPRLNISPAVFEKDSQVRVCIENRRRLHGSLLPPPPAAHEGSMYGLAQLPHHVWLTVFTRVALSNPSHRTLACELGTMCDRGALMESRLVELACGSYARRSGIEPVEPQRLLWSPQREGRRRDAVVCVRLATRERV